MTTIGTGTLGEDIATKYLNDRGYVLLERNFKKKWGEIDVIAKKDGIIHFVEVKAVSHVTRFDLEKSISKAEWRPEEHVDEHKKRKLRQIIETWLQDHKEVSQFQVDVCALRIVENDRYASIEYLENVIL